MAEGPAADSPADSPVVCGWQLISPAGSPVVDDSPADGPSVVVERKIVVVIVIAVVAAVVSVAGFVVGVVSRR